MPRMPNQVTCHQVEVKIMRGLLDLVILEFLHIQPMHGYQLISNVRKKFGVYFGPSTVYPLLGLLEKKGYIKSTWDLNNDRPRKVYVLTHEGESLLGYTEAALNQILSKMLIKVEAEVPVNVARIP